jgi:hypothetical protein
VLGGEVGRSFFDGGGNNAPRLYLKPEVPALAAGLEAGGKGLVA